MKYSEATKLIKGLSKKYSINNDKSAFGIIYKSMPVTWVDNQQQFIFRVVDASEFNELPYSHKLWMILAELAMTPLDKRKDEHKWNVIIGNDDSEVEVGFGSIIAWKKDSLGHGYLLSLNDSDSLTNDEVVFTDEEFSALIKYIKKLPDGEWQAKVAEHGKTEVKSEEGDD
ncbi:hypothetical protein KOM07_04180 [Lentilactobacillus sp. G22-6]|uniref:hypothetical protein n=1 Tax=Lentilactobacillus dabitei TaxID=2831523 RepID=UPI001C27D6E3|nr:hypothetical protein [Lentilactobacillus dabitei]MBU9788756.1 hypothetical protein [Lentilactobacillus dabitei]